MDFAQMFPIYEYVFDFTKICIKLFSFAKI